MRTTYVVTFEESRIGRYRNVEPITIQTTHKPATEAHVDEVHDAILRTAKRHLISPDVDMEFLLNPISGKGLGTVFAGTAVAASFTIRKEES